MEYRRRATRVEAESSSAGAQGSRKWRAFAIREQTAPPEHGDALDASRSVQSACRATTWRVGTAIQRRLRVAHSLL